MTSPFFARLWPVAAAALVALGTPAHAQSATEADLARRLDQLAAELAKVKAELASLQQQQRNAVPAGSAAAVGGSSAGAAQSSAATATAAPTAEPARAEPATVFSSYGELNYNRPTRRSEATQADLRRFVLGFQHRFDAKTHVVAELEVEHAVSSSGDPGEVALEQAYVEHQITPRLGARAGLFLMPVGLLNENHEPTAFYGVERNFVETAIIPTTWREGGLQLIHQFDNGLTLQGGVSTSFDLTKWDAASTEGVESPLGAVHQEMALAKARDLALFAAANWRGIPGLLVGGSIFSGNATHAQSPAKGRVTLWDLHTRWTPGRWDLSALYARGAIGNTAALNLPLVGNPTLIPERFDGWYVQAAYRLWQRGGMSLSPFVRHERFNTGRSYADLGAGLTPSALPTEAVTTLGANFLLTPGVVLKADWQRFRENRDADRVNLGVGWSF